MPYNFIKFKKFHFKRDKSIQIKGATGSDYIKKNPIKRLGLPSDISPLCIFLSSNASDYISGQNFLVDGGWSII